MEERSLPLLGEETIKELANSHIAIFGIGGVGGFVVEALARQGIGEFSLYDYDKVNSSNKNRQIIASESTLGQYKAEVMKRRILDINPKAVVHISLVRIDDSSVKEIDFSSFTYVADCIDDLKGKLAILRRSKEFGVPILSCCGTGNKLDPMKFQIKDISKTSVCPLAKRLRLEAKKEGISHFDVLFSTEEPVESKEFIASVSFVPSVAGLLIARHIILWIHERVIQDRIHLVLEGGGMKGVYTAGVLDFFLEQKLEFTAVYGVSAGACTGSSFVSKQKGRGYHAMVDYLGDPNYASKRSLTKTGNYFNKEFIYRRLPDELIPFDYEAARQNPCKLYATVTNVETGTAEYHLCSDFHKDIDYVCASSSLPMLAEIQQLDGKGYLDGGLADPIPYVEAKKNARRCVVISTKPEGYLCVKQNSLLLRAMKLKYHKYPKLLRAIEHRHIVYNHTMKLIEKDKNVFILRPSKSLEISRLESNKAKLEELYQLGYQDARDKYEALLEFMGKSKEENL